MSTYGNRLRKRLDLQAQPQFGQVRRSLPEAWYEKQFQKELTAGFNTSKSNRCDQCFTYRGRNGQCNCEL